MRVRSDRRRLPDILLMLMGIAGAGMSLAGALTPSLADPPALASDWAGPKYGRARLIAGQPEGATAGTLYAGVQIKLESGWKTYWRQPGEAGVPPRFDWSGSTNVARARALYPAPSRMRDAGLDSLGYKKDVVFPIEITPADAGQPVALKLAFDYGVCKDICVPVEARLGLDLPAGFTSSDAAAARTAEGALIGAALGRVPVPGRKDGPSIVSLDLVSAGDRPQLVVEARFPKGSVGADLLIEADGGELLALPVIAARQGADRVRFVSRLDSEEARARLAGKSLTLTLVSDTDQAEASARVPAQR